MQNPNYPTTPTYPTDLLAELEPGRAELREIIAEIKRHPDRLDLWRDADAINPRQSEIVKAYFSGKGAAA